MKRLLIAGACLAMLAAPAAMAEPRTELVKDGKAVNNMLLRYKFDAVWVVDAERILSRDVNFDHYLVTLDKPCNWLLLQKEFYFYPMGDRLRQSLPYDIRDDENPNCNVKRIETIDRQTAQTLREKLVKK